VTLAERKRELRHRISALRCALPAAERERAALAVAERVVVMPEFARATSLVLYAALPEELSTRPLFEKARAAGKDVWLPKVTEQGLEFASVSAWDDLVPGAFGILEPPAAGLLLTAELILVPGVAFDASGYRLGYGKGFYDRWLARLPAAPRARFGVAFEVQVVSEVPREVSDIHLDGVVTEKTLRRVRVAAGDA